MAASAYHVISKEVENRVFRQNRIFKRTFMCKQSILPYWQSSGIIIIAQILYSYLRYTDRLLDVLFLLLTVSLWASWESKKKRLSYTKKYTKEIVWGTSLFGCTPSLLCHFLSLFSPTPSLSSTLILRLGVGAPHAPPPSVYGPAEKWITKDTETQKTITKKDGNLVLHNSKIQTYIKPNWTKLYPTQKMPKIQFRSSFKDCSGELLLYFVHGNNFKGYAAFKIISKLFDNKFMDICSNITRILIELLTNSQEFCVNICTYIY